MDLFVTFYIEHHPGFTLKEIRVLVDVPTRIREMLDDRLFARKIKSFVDNYRRAHK